MDKKVEKLMMAPTFNPFAWRLFLISVPQLGLKLRISSELQMKNPIVCRGMSTYPNAHAKVEKFSVRFPRELIQL